MEEQIKDLIKECVSAYTCDVCGGGGTDDENKTCSECKGCGLVRWIIPDEMIAKIISIVKEGN